MYYMLTPFGKLYITQFFGKNPSMYAQFGMAGHNGVDMKGIEDNYCFDAGIANVLYDKNGYGNFVRVTTDSGFVDTYAHFENIIIEDGQRVERWQKLGKMGTTGYSTGVHLHYGRKPKNPDRNNGYFGSIDPMLFLRSIETNTLPNEDMTPEERQQFKELLEMKTAIQVAMKAFRIVEGSGKLVYDTELAGQNPNDVKGTIWADSQALAALMRVAKVPMIKKSDAKKSKYIGVDVARYIKK